jgi:hypothetical protein
MATSLNTHSTRALLANFVQSNNPFGSNSVLRIFPSTVAYPTLPVETVAALPAGHILSYSGLTCSVTNGIMTITGGTTATNTTAAGTLGWWVWYGGVNGVVISDSISVSGSGGNLVVSTMTPSSGTSVSVSLNLSIV